MNQANTDTTFTTDEQKARINTFLDAVIEKLGLKNDAALSRALQVAPPVISKTRHLALPFGLHLMVRIHDVAGLSLSDIRAALGIAPLVPANGTV